MDSPAHRDIILDSKVGRRGHRRARRQYGYCGCRNSPSRLSSLSGRHSHDHRRASSQFSFQRNRPPRPGVRTIVTGQVGLDKNLSWNRTFDSLRHTGTRYSYSTSARPDVRRSADVAPGRILDLPTATDRSSRRSVFRTCSRRPQPGPTRPGQHITTGTYNDGTYNWAVPSTPSSNCLVKVQDNNISTLTDVSSQTFTIKAGNKSLRITSPNGGERISAVPIIPLRGPPLVPWSYIALSYSTSGGASWNSITYTAANTGTYDWKTPSRFRRKTV